MRLLASFLFLVALSGCAVVDTTVGVVGTAVETTADVTGSVVGGTVDVVTSPMRED